MLASMAGAIPTDWADRYDGDPPLPGRSAMERLDEIALYRFRVRTADGREAVSRVVATRRPVRARLGSEDEMTSLAAEEEHPPMLATPGGPAIRSRTAIARASRSMPGGSTDAPSVSSSSSATATSGPRWKP